MAQLSEATARPVTSIQFSNGDGMEGILKKLVKMAKKGEKLDRAERGYTGELMVQRIYDVIVTLRHRIQHHSIDLSKVSVRALQRLGGITDANGLASALASALKVMSVDEFLGFNSEDIDGDILALVSHAKARIVASSPGLKGAFGGIEKRSVVERRGMTPRHVENRKGERVPREIELSVLKSPGEITSNAFEELDYMRVTRESNAVISAHTSDESLPLDELDSFKPLEFSDVHPVNLGSITNALVNMDARRQKIGGFTGLHMLVKLKEFMLWAKGHLDSGAHTFEQVARGAALNYLGTEHGITQEGNLLTALQLSIGHMPEATFRNTQSNGPLPQIVRAIRECQGHLS